MGPGVLWVAALLASLLSLPRLFAADYADGTLEQIALSPYPLAALVSGKILAHWLTTGLPVVLLAPLLGVQYAMDGESLAVLTAALLLGTPILSLLGAIGAALTLGLRAGGSLLALLDPAAVRAGADLRRRRGRCRARRARRRRATVAARRGTRSSPSSARRSPPRPPCGSRSIDSIMCSTGTATRRPRSFYPLAGKMIPWFAWVGGDPGRGRRSTSACRSRPTDFQQGEAYRIIFIHVPAAWMSMFLYLVMAFWSALALGFNTRLSAMMAQAIAPTGALMTFIALVDGRRCGDARRGERTGRGTRG